LPLDPILAPANPAPSSQTQNTYDLLSYLVEDGLLHWRLVKTGRLIGDRLEVLAGLAGGEKVVVSGIDKAVSGSRVEN